MNKILSDSNILEIKKELLEELEGWNGQTTNLDGREIGMKTGLAIVISIIKKYK